MARDPSTDANPREAVDRDTDELLAWLDGELPAKRATEVARAIEKSPLLQSRLRELQWDLQLHSDLSKNELPPSAPALEDALQDFKTRLTRECESEAAAESALCAVIPIRQSWLGRRWPRVAACTVLSVGITAYWLGYGPMSHVLARNVIDRAVSTEQYMGQGISAPVIHQRLRASRRGTPAASENTASWEIWNRVDVPEFHEQVNAIVTDPNQPGAASPSVVAELKDIFLHNGIDSGRPLSTLAYRNWRIVNRAQDEWKPTRTDSGEIAFAITSTATGPYAANALREIEVTVRASDWHTVGQRMRVQSAGGVREYELNETSYEVVSLGSLPTTVFGPPTTTASPSSLHENVAAPVLPLPARESILAATTSPPDNVHSGLVAAAIETQYALHKLNVCIEEQLTVELTKDGQVVVRGTVPDLKRWQQIADGLSGLHAKPQLEISILAANSSPKVSPMGSSAATNSTASAASDQALIHATALYQLADENYTSPVAVLPRDSQWLMEIMVRDHLAEIAKSLAQLPHSPELAQSQASSASDLMSGWPTGAAILLQDIRTLDALLQNGPQAPTQPGISAPELRQRILLRLTMALSDPAAVAAAWFSDSPVSVRTNSSTQN